MDSNKKSHSGYDFWRDNVFSYGIDEAIIICGNYIDLNLKREHSDDECQFCRETFAAMYEATATKIIPSKLVYPYDFKTANDRMETSYFHKNREMNIECARAIDAAISASCYKMNYYNLELAAISVIGRHGFQRVNAVLAHQIQNHESDGRYSANNKKWAKGFILPDKTYTFLGSHATLIEDFATYTRKLYDNLGADSFALLGSEECGESVHGYEIIRSIMFSANQGHAIAHNPTACDSFVCWQFTVKGGRRDYYWGIYGSEQAAIDGYNARMFVRYN